MPWRKKRIQDQSGHRHKHGLPRRQPTQQERAAPHADVHQLPRELRAERYGIRARGAHVGRLSEHALEHRANMTLVLLHDQYGGRGIAGEVYPFQPITRRSAPQRRAPVRMPRASAIGFA